MYAAFCSLVIYDNVILSEEGYCRKAFYLQTSESVRQWTNTIEHIFLFCKINQQKHDYNKFINYYARVLLLFDFTKR